MIDVLVILLAPQHSTILLIYPFLLIPFFIVIVWMFIYAYKSKRLSDIHPLIVGLGFLFYLLTTIFRAIGLDLVDPKIATILSEFLEICATLVIFIGLIKKAKYQKANQ
ncbi:MAG: hypothetical protein GF311_01330 [Candidatus Lokiarchaeota archaeon]|nr:hypothetical protein [Candidatus Lokiarchaeota archaeon]